MDKQTEKVVGLYSNSKNYYNPLRQDYVKYYKQYRSWLDVDSMRDYYKWRSKLFIPATARAVDGLLPDLLLTLMPNNSFFETKPRESEDVIQASINQGLLSYDFDVDDSLLKAYVYIKQMALYGTTFGKCFWKTTKKEETIEVDDLILGKQKSKQSVVLFDGPTFVPIDIFSVYYSPKATSLSDTWVIHRTEKSIREMKELGIYQNIDKLEECIVSDMNSDADRYEIEIRKYKQGLPAAYSGEEGDDRKVELLEYWNADRTKTMTIAGQHVVVRPERDNPLGVAFDPFICSALWPNPFELQGVGVPEKVRDLQDQLNSEVNQRLDNRNLRQNFIIKVKRGSNVNVRNIVSRPGAIWLTDDMGALDVVNVPDISSASSFAEENMLEGKCEEITGVTKYVTGGGTDSRRTATESSILQRMGSKQFALHVKMLEDTFIKPMIRKFHVLNQKFITKEQVVKIVGPKGNAFINSSYEDSMREFDIITTSSSELLNKDLKVQQMTTLYQMAATDPTVTPEEKRKLRQRIWETWGYKDFETFPTIGAPQVPMQPQGMPPMQLPPQNETGPINPSGLRASTPMEGTAPLALGGGGNAMAPQ